MRDKGLSPASPSKSRQPDDSRLRGSSAGRAAAGQILPFEVYLAQARRRRPRPLIWRWPDVEAALTAFRPTERGNLALADPGAVEGGAIVSGLSLAVQVVPAGKATAAHAHSFWHLYLVRQGSGTAVLDAGGTPNAIGTGDTLLIPAWCPHSFDNRDNKQDLVLLVLQNLPQNASLDSLVREDADGRLRVVYDADQDR